MNSPNPSTGGRWAERTATAGDLNADGVHDIWVGVPKDVVGGAQIGRVYAMNGATLVGNPNHPPQVLYTINSPEPQAGKNFGFFISNLGDVNGDQVADIAVGTDAQNVGTRLNQGKAWVFSGTHGALLYALDNPQPQGSPIHRARFGSRIGRAGDLTGDGHAEVIVGASGNDVPAACSEASPVPANCHAGQGQAFIFNGHTGALFRTLDLPDPVAAPCTANCGNFGLAVQGSGDADGDGVVDQLVDASNLGVTGPDGTFRQGQGRMYLFSGHTGALIRRIDDPVPQVNAFFGFQDAAPLAPGDVNGDGHDDIYGNGFFQTGPAGVDQGRSWVFSGADGSVLYELANPNPSAGGQFGWSMDKTDYNLDGHPDLYVGDSPHHVAGVPQPGDTNVFKGADGTLLKNLPLPPPYNAEVGSPSNLGPNLGWTVSAPGDLDHDGEPDYVAGAPFTDVPPNQDQGVMIVFVSS